MMLWATWWVWALGGLGLAILEVLAPGYVFLGFALGAGAVAGLLALGLGPWSVPVLIVVFSILSLLAVVALRRVFPHSSGDVKIWKDDING